MNPGERFSLDSNILVYAADPHEAARQATSIAVIVAATGGDCVLVPQALAEFYAVVTRKRIMAPGSAAAQIRDWLDLFPLAPGPTADALLRATEGHRRGRFQFYDALLLATAEAAGCAAVISEDMHSGAQFGNVRVVGAFDADNGISTAARTLLPP